MTSILVLHHSRLSVSQAALTTTCDLFRSAPQLAQSPYFVRSSVPLSILTDFISAIEGATPALTDVNWSGLWELSGEFGFGHLAVQLSGFGFRLGWVDSVARARISALEERSSAHDHLLSELRRSAAQRAPSAPPPPKRAREGHDMAAVLGRLSAVERELSQLHAAFARQQDDLDAARFRLKYERSRFTSGRMVTKVAVVGPAGDSERRLRLAAWCDAYECGVKFEFLSVDGDSALPAGADGAVICGPARPPGWSGASVRVGFAGGCCGGAECTVDVRTGSGVGAALAVLVSRARGSDGFAFADGGRTLNVVENADWGVRVWGRAEAGRTVRVFVAETVYSIGGIWAPLLPHVAEIEFAHPCSVEPRTFAGLRFSRVVVGGLETEARALLGDACLGFETAPWAAAFRSGDDVAAALAGRSSSDISQVSGFVPLECQEWPQLRDCGSFAFAFSRLPSFEFAGEVLAVGERAFYGSSLESIAVPDSVSELGAHCFACCRLLRDALLGCRIRALPEGLFRNCMSLQFVKAASRLERIGDAAFEETESLRDFDVGSAHIGQSAFRGSGLVWLTLSGGHSRECGEGAFARCLLLREAVLDLVVVPGCLFDKCPLLARVALTGEVTEISYNAFDGCAALRSIDLSALQPDASIESKAFRGSGLVEVTLPARLSSIDSKAFKDCTSLVEVRLPQELTDLGPKVFAGCTSLRTLVVGDVRRSWSGPESLLGGVKLSRLELIGDDFEALAELPIEEWLAEDGAVVSAAFAGRDIRGLSIRGP